MLHIYDIRLVLAMRFWFVNTAVARANFDANPKRDNSLVRYGTYVVKRSYICTFNCAFLCHYAFKPRACRQKALMHIQVTTIAVVSICFIISIQTCVHF